MPSKPLKPLKPLELRLWLSEEASTRINERIINGKLSILRDINPEESKLERLGRIVLEANKILQDNEQSIYGCSREQSVTAWLKREGKEITVFKALCQAVDENWLEVFDKSIYTEFFIGEHKEIVDFFINSASNLFSFSFEESLTFNEYRQQIKELTGFNNFESETIVSLIKTFIKEFAINGRQIRFRVSMSSNPCLITSIRVEGHNQNNILSTWSFDYNKPYPYVVETENWWWHGNVNFQLKILSNNQELSYSCDAFVPQKGYIWTEILLNLDTGICKVQ